MSPKRNRDPSLVNPNTVTNTELSHSKPFCTKDTFKMSPANITCMSNPFQTNCQSIPFLFLEKANAIKSNVIIPNNPLIKLLNENPLPIIFVSLWKVKLMPFSFRVKDILLTST